MTTENNASDALALSYAPVCFDELESLFELRALAMHGMPVNTTSGVTIDRNRILKSFLAGIAVEDAQHILLDGQRIGFVVVQQTGQELWLSHLNFFPEYHNRGIGSVVLSHLFARADAAKLPLRVAAMRQSPSNRFYLRHGFVKTGENTWDFIYMRPAGGAG